MSPVTFHNTAITVLVVVVSSLGLPLPASSVPLNKRDDTDLGLFEVDPTYARLNRFYQAARSPVTMNWLRLIFLEVLEPTRDLKSRHFVFSIGGDGSSTTFITTFFSIVTTTSPVDATLQGGGTVTLPDGESEITLSWSGLDTDSVYEAVVEFRNNADNELLLSYPVRITTF